MFSNFENFLIKLFNFLKIYSLFYQFLLIIFILNNFYLFVSATSQSPPFGKLYVKNGKLLGDNGRRAQLRGISLFHSQLNEGAVFYNEETVYALKCSWHANIVSLDNYYF